MATEQRNRIAELAALGIAYFLAAAGTISVTRFDGGFAFLWVATAILTARLTTLRRAEWGGAIVVCGVASAAATMAFGLGPHLALPMAIVNVAEATIGAAILRRTVGRHAFLDSHRWLIWFVIATGMVAPAFGAICGSGIASLVLGKPFLVNAIHWYSGHALGTLAFMPIAVMVMRGDAHRLIRSTRKDKIGEIAAMLLLVAGVTTVTFAQDRMPILFLPMLPVVLATFRGGALSTAASIVIISIIGAILTLDGHGPIAMIDAPVGERMQFLQLYIAATMLTVLPANAELERRAHLFRALRESEARYRLVTESSTDIVMTVDPAGTLRFVSASARQLDGRDPETLVGQHFAAIVRLDDVDRAIETLEAALRPPYLVPVAEFRAPCGSGDHRWFESHGCAVRDEDGAVTDVVIALRDVTHRKAHEAQLTRAALTDPLTGLANRRAFLELLDDRIAAGSGGCVAMFDIDHFKRVNDCHGHAAGDEVLRRFAAIARSSLREQDLPARLGGEEFAVILPDSTIAQAHAICDRLRIAIAGARITRGDVTIAVTVSGGVARYDRDDRSDDVLHHADMALYRAKTDGRDRLTLAA